jgi:acyl carrier protein
MNGQKGHVMNEIHPKIVEVLTQTFKVPAAEILPEATMDSLEMDSLAVAEFTVVIKEALGIDTAADQLLKGATLAGITAFLDGASVGVTR